MGFGDQSLITLWLANPVMTLAALGLAVSDNTVVEFKYPASRELMVYKHKNGSLFVGSEDEVSLLLEMDEKEWEDVELIGKAEHFN